MRAGEEAFNRKERKERTGGKGRRASPWASGQWRNNRAARVLLATGDRRLATFLAGGWRLRPLETFLAGAGGWGWSSSSTPLPQVRCEVEGDAGYGDAGFLGEDALHRQAGLVMEELG